MLKSKKLFFFIFLASFVGIIWYHNVDKKVTKEDIEYGSYFFNEINFRRDTISFPEEIQFIKQIQSNVLNIAPLYRKKGIPFNQTREPKDLYSLKEGLCFDRSRVIEKILMSYGFETRHVALYQDKVEKSNIKELMSSGTHSHAITEVLTQKGWMIVDSNAEWIGLDNDSSVYSCKKIQYFIQENKNISWQLPYPQEFKKFYGEECHVIYGLYSRHGKFYPPYNFIPDYNLRELLYNFEL
jgi:hypothetical protein